MSELALKLIREAKETKAIKLDLGNCGLTELPDELFDLVWLEELYLSNRAWQYDSNKRQKIYFIGKNEGKENNIKYLQPNFYKFEKLRILQINGRIGNRWVLNDITSLGSLKNLEQLDISGTRISDLGSLSPLTRLQSLIAMNTLINDLTPLGSLKNLEQLDISGTLVSDLSSLKTLNKLKIVSARHTEIKDLNSFEELINLEVLGLGGSRIKVINSLKFCKNLKEVYLWRSEVVDLNPLKDLRKLEVLGVSHTSVSDLPSLENLESLRTFNLYQTKVSNLRPLKRLIEKGMLVKWSSYQEGINVENCPLTNPPIAIVKQGNEAILNYWKQIEEQGGTETINEAKLIIVGEGNTGKTTLFNKLIDPKFDLSKTPTAETQGINIKEGLVIKEDFRANLWDFGGQELQYMTHQFFLTPNAVYVLMMAAREEAPNLAYWFKIISLLGKDKSGTKVSLVIVLNKKKGSTGMPQYQDLLKIYENDFDYQFIEVDLAVDDNRWESLKDTIEQRLIDLPIVKNKLPKQWKPIRESIREKALKRPYIDAASLGKICQPFEVREESDQFLMTEYLHQLGSLLHFQNDEDDLIDLIVLSPEWVVEGVYTVLKNERIKKTLKGKFSINDMTKILCANTYKIDGKEKKYSKVDAQKLIQLMSKNNFDICYRSESGKYVAAQLLPDDRPSNYKWNTNFYSALQFRYRYPIMPKGLMSRLIVRLSDNLEIKDGQEIVWKKGAILNMEFDGSRCRVLMREEDGESKTGLREIVIEVMEDKPPYRNRKYALQRVRQEIESLHKRWFKNIASEQIVPCNCEECKDIDKPFTYNLSELMKLKKGRAYCNIQEDFVPLVQLLEGVYEPKEIESFTQNRGMNRHD